MSVLPVPPAHRHQASLEAAAEPWLVRAPAEERERYFSLLDAATASQAKARAVFARLQAPEAFAGPLLVAGLQQRFNLTIDVQGCELVRAFREEGALESRLRVSRASLLEAAMQNFEPDEPLGTWSVLLPDNELTFDLHELPSGRVSRRWKYDTARALTLKPQAFAQACRAIDLGRLYAEHLDSELGRPGVAAQLRGNFLAGLAAQAQRAFMRQHIGAPARDCLLNHASGGTLWWGGQAACASSLKLLVSAARSGYELVGPVVFQRNDGSPGCIAYLPGDPDQPVKEYASLQLFADDLGQRLRQTEYLGWFKGFVAHDEQPAFVHRLVNTLTPRPVAVLFPKDPQPDPHADIGLRIQALAGDTSLACHQRWQERVMHNGAAVMVPTAQADRQARDKRLMSYLADGLGVLNVAAFFVPGVGVLMLGVGAVQLFADVFVGIDDWQHGQTEEALAHFASVVENLAVVAAGVGAGMAIHRSPFVEGMEWVRDAQGNPKLWHADVAGYRLPPQALDGLAPNAEGIYQRGGRRFVRLADGDYEVAQAPTGRWEMLHPHDPSRFRPLLVHNGEGAWQMAHERPGSWQGLALMRRWGASVEGLDDAQLLRLQRSSGLTDEQLRACHVQRRPMPAVLKDALARLKLQRTLRGQAFDAAYAQLQTVDPGDAGLLLRDFPGLPAVLAQEIMASATDAERASQVKWGRLPLRLAEAARLALRQLRLNRAIEGLYLEPGANPDADRLADGLAGAGLQRSQLAKLAAQDRNRCAAILGQRDHPAWFRSPLRQGELPGYSLSGRGQGAMLPDERLRRLYPTVGQAEIVALREAIAREGGVDEGLDRLEAEYQSLATRLADWVNTPGGYPGDDGQRIEVAAWSRQRVHDFMLAAWRRESPVRTGVSATRHGFTLNLSQLYLGDLPALGASFPHVEQLYLDDIQLSADPSGFLRQFPNLRCLSLAQNRLTAIPQQVAEMGQLRILDLESNRIAGSADAFAGLGSGQSLQELLLAENTLERLAPGWPAPDDLPQLQRLDLSSNSLRLGEAGWRRIAALPALRTLQMGGNQISLDAATRQVLAGMTRLRQLYLHENPLLLPPDVTAMGQLRVLSLASTSIDQLPVGLVPLMARAQTNLQLVDLSDNLIRDVPLLPERVTERLGHRSPGQHSITFSIFNNPLSEGSMDNLRVLGDEDVGVHFSSSGSSTPVPWEGWQAGLPADLRNAIAQEREAPQARLFFDVLARCTETADFHVDSEGTLARMRAIAEAILRPAAGTDGEAMLELREQLFEEAEDIGGTCGDGVSLVINRFETVIAAWRAASSALVGGSALFEPLVRVSERLLRLALVDDSVMAISRARLRRRGAIRVGMQADNLPARHPLDDIADADLQVPTDEVELRLLARRRLADPLGPYAMDLPTQPQNVLFTDLLSGHTLAAIRDEVQRLATRPALLDWLSQQRYWANYLKKAQPQVFAELEQRWAQAADYFEHVALTVPAEGMAPPESASAQVYTTLEQALPERHWRAGGVALWLGLGEQDYLADYNQLVALRAQALASLARQLTAPLLGAHSRLPAA